MKASTNIPNLVCESCWELCFSTDGYKAYCKDTTGDSKFEYLIDEDYCHEAERKCKWCALVVRHSTGWEDEDRYRRTEGKISVQFTVGYSEEVFMPLGKNRPLLRVNGVPFKSTTFASQESPASNIVTARPLRTDVTSDQSFDEMKQWLRSCENHSGCQPLPTSILPARVIDVGSADGTKLPRLLETNQLHGKYAALSYCWGDRQLGVTTKSNLADRLTILETACLSKTVQEAIMVTQKIGLQYLWCDAICLCQNSEEDVAKELKHMTSIFKSAHVTIVAANAADSASGFLSCPRQPDLHAIEIPFWSSTDELCTIRFRREDYYSEDSPHSRVREPISDRCWAFQEKLLSRRRIIFASHTVQFQCREQTINLGNSLHTGNEFDSWRLAPFVRSLFTQHNPDIYYDLAISIWKNVVIQYSSRFVTYEDDKLVALAALTEAFYKYIQTPYLAGLWAGPALPSLLLWKATGDITSPSPAAYVAPSWSWASMQTPVEFDFHFEDHKADKDMSIKIISIHMELKNEKLPFGKVSNGSLIVSALMKNASFILPTPDEVNGSAFGTAWLYPISKRVVKIENGTMVHAILDDPNETDTEDIQCLAVFVGDFDPYGCGGKIVEGILVKEVTSQNNTLRRYRRIGRFFHAYGEDFIGLEAVVLELV